MLPTHKHEGHLQHGLASLIVQASVLITRYSLGEGAGGQAQGCSSRATAWGRERGGRHKGARSTP